MKAHARRAVVVTHAACPRWHSARARQSARIRGRRRAAAALAWLFVGLSAVPAHATAARASLPAIERKAMCVTCKIPLDEAQSPQADRERAFIRALIADGRDEAQIDKALVAQYGSAVLALPSAHGFDLAAYAIPVAAMLALLALLALLLPAWRRRARSERQPDAPAQPLSAEDAARLDADIAQFD